MSDSFMEMAPDAPASTGAVIASARRQGYFNSTRSLTFGILMTLPLLLIYEAGNEFMNAGKVMEIKNGADVILENVFTMFGRSTKTQSLLILLFGLVLAVAIESFMRWPRIRAPYFLSVLGEALALSFLLAPLSAWLMNPTQSFSALFALPGLPSIDGFFGKVIDACGAGFYEELLYRVFLVGCLIGLFRMIRMQRQIATLTATLLGAAIFSGVHHIGSLGDPFSLEVFTFRFMGGIVLNLIYTIRGFAVAAWTHALYDIWVMTGVL